MYKSAALAFYKKPAAIARALKISRSAVTQWPDIVPEASALKLEKLTGGALRVQPELYEPAPLEAPSAA